MSDLLKRLHEQRMAAVKAAREIAERMSTSEAPNAEDEAAYTKANEEVSRLGKLATDERKRVEAENEDAEAFEAAEKRAGVKRDREREERKTDWQDAARQAIKDGQRSKGGVFESLPSPERLRELRALTDPVQITAATHGPETVRETLVERLYQKLFEDSAILDAGPTILRTGTGEALKFPRLTSLGALPMTSARRAEMQQIQRGNPTFDQIELGAHKYAQISQASREVIEDSVIDVRGLLGTVLGRNMANYLGYDLTHGDGGTNQPRGVATIAATNAITGPTGTGGAPANMDDILNVIAALPRPYRRGARFVINDAMSFVLRKFKLNTTTGENAYAWQPSIVPGGPDTLMGYPVLLDPNIEDADLGALSILFFNPAQYYVRLVNDVRVEWSTEYAWDTDVVSVKAVLRADADAIDDTAFTGFVGGAS